MLWDDLYLAGVGAHLPEQIETVEEAIAAGRYTTEKLEMNGYRAVRVAPAGQTAPMMAVLAAKQALARAGIAAERFGLVAHSYNSHQGLDFWPPASYIQNETIGGSCPALEIRQVCNGLMMAIDVAGRFISAEPGGGAALLTGGDAFRLPYIDRWASHPQSVYGDGAAALVLSTEGGFARVRATHSFGDPTLEPVARAGRPWTDGPFDGARTVRFEAILTGVDMDETVAKISAGVKRSVDEVLEQAGLGMSDVRFFLHQQLAESIAEYGLYQLLDIERKATTFDFGIDKGMISTVDMVLGLNHLITAQEVQPGDRVLLMGSAAGYSWTTVLLEFLDVPRWTD